ncbi:MAG: Hsp20 family protein [Alphaproteobacteria bacterium]
MHAYDLSPLFRSGVGFDHLSRMIDSAFKADERAQAYPPYNIARMGEDEYEVTMAVAGFKQSELSVVAQQNSLVVTGNSETKEETKGKEYLHRGIANRSFERKFSLADHVKVVDAHLENGLLTLRMKREIPEESKPKVIAINSGNLLEGKKAK